MDELKKFQIFLEEKLINFSILVTELVQTLPNTYHCNYISSQLTRSATSSALNYGEVRGAESSSDLIHKMKIVLKELRESYVSIRIIKKKNWTDNIKINICINECNELISIFVTSIQTAETNRRNRTIKKNF